MLKLLYFVPCERVIISIDKTATFVNALDKITFTPTMAVTKDAAIDFRWDTIALWYRTDENDNNKEFEQNIEVYRPDNTLAFNSITKFKSMDVRHKIINNIGAFPVGVAGTVLIKVLLREIGQDEWQQMAEYPIELVIVAGNKNLNLNNSPA